MTLLSARSRGTVNVNTAPAEVLVAAIGGLDATGAAALVASRTQTPFGSIADFRTAAEAMGYKVLVAEGSPIPAMDAGAPRGDGFPPGSPGPR